MTMNFPTLLHLQFLFLIENRDQHYIVDTMLTFKASWIYDRRDLYVLQKHVMITVTSVCGTLHRTEGSLMRNGISRGITTQYEFNRFTRNDSTNFEAGPAGLRTLDLESLCY